ncbi:hypothetical protein L1987_06351 [Smallanthus sonchifolius]|uniref:Uncharacterized protein n=1 Tax=Smallanthus sonchifolius TaxID=185202 RepID=A0ACB9JXW0_9ASTR|nr:hypothetical protein L1987_06351 [Smallanthus sonchifolius]
MSFLPDNRSETTSVPKPLTLTSYPTSDSIPESRVSATTDHHRRLGRYGTAPANLFHPKASGMSPSKALKLPPPRSLFMWNKQVYTVDFVILCLGRFKDVPNIPEFPAGKGPEVFRGQVIHSMEYAAMDAKVAEEFVKGKKVVVVGFGKTGLDIARECSSINVSKFVESHIKRKLPLTKFNIVPQHSFSKDIRSCKITYLPNRNDFFDEVEKGSIKLKKSQTFSFYNTGILIGDDHSTQIEAEVVIYATGFKGVQKLKDIFEYSRFGEFIAGSPRVPLYRECIHPQIPQLAIIGFSESLSNLYISEMRSKWLVALLEGVFKLPSVKEMQKDIVQWDDYMNQSAGEYHYRSSIGALEIWYNDQLCKDMGMNPMRKNGPLANLFEPYGPIDYTKIEA